jgi:hypothetical protein
MAVLRPPTSRLSSHSGRILISDTARPCAIHTPETGFIEQDTRPPRAKILIHLVMKAV